MKTSDRKQHVESSGPRNLLLSLGVVALVWGIVLPNLSRAPRNAAYLDWLEERHIDPSAMFYTDLDCVDLLLQPDRRDLLEDERT